MGHVWVRANIPPTEETQGLHDERWLDQPRHNHENESTNPTRKSSQFHWNISKENCTWTMKQKQAWLSVSMLPDLLYTQKRTNRSSVSSSVCLVGIHPTLVLMWLTAVSVSDWLGTAEENQAHEEEMSRSERGWRDLLVKWSIWSWFSNIVRQHMLFMKAWMHFCLWSGRNSAMPLTLTLK